MAKKASRLQVMNILRYLEQTGNVKETAKKFGVSRTAIYKWKEQYEEEYRETKNDIDEYSITVEAQKMILKKGTLDLTEKTITLFESIVDHFIEFPENLEKVSARDKVNLLNVILPYVLEKKGTLPPSQLPGKGETNTQNNFFMNIIQQMKDGDSEDNIRRNIEAITTTQHPGRES